MMQRPPYQVQAAQQKMQATQGQRLPGTMGPMQHGLQVPTSPNQVQQPQQNVQQQAYKQALMSMYKTPKPLPIALSTTPNESPVIDANDNVLEIQPKTEQDAVQVVEDQDSRDNLNKTPTRGINLGNGQVNYP